MKIFAIELSSRFGSIALVDNDGVVAEKSWEENFKNRQQLFDAMASLNMDWNGVDLFAARSWCVFRDAHRLFRGQFPGRSGREAGLCAQQRRGSGRPMQSRPHGRGG